MPKDYRIGKLGDGLVVTWWGDDGKRRRYRLAAQSRAEAEVEAVKVIREHVIKPDGCVIDQLWEAYRKEKTGRRIATTMEFEWRFMKPFFGQLRPDQVSVDLCRAYTEVRRGAGKKDGTIWTELGHLRTVLRWAVDKSLIRHAAKVERPAKPAPKERWLNHGEIQRLLEAPKAHHIQLAILLMLATAGRIGAILELEWKRVDFERGTVNLRSTETGPRKGRAIVPMNDGLRAALSHAKAVALTDYVIEWGGEPVKSIKTGFNRACTDAKLDDVSPHTLRHTAAVHLAMNDVPMQRISQYLGHSSVSVTERVYARYAPEHLREEAAILDFTKRAQVV